MDEAMWNELTEVFRKLTTAYGAAVSIGERKHAALVTVDMKSLEKILNEEQLIIAKIERLEKSRGAILAEMAKQNPMITAETKMEEFITLAPSRQIEDQLRALHKELSDKVDETVRLRDNNQILAQGALDAVNYHLNRLGGATVEQSYSKKGGNVVTHRKNFDYKA